MTNSMGNGHYEIEHKFLCLMPSKDLLKKLASDVLSIEQTYLKAPKGEERRVRRIISQNKVSYVFTTKMKLTELKRKEEERDISESEYMVLLQEADPELHTIRKERYKVPYLGYIFEIDVYEFDDKNCVMEVEVSEEDEKVTLPGFITIVKEVTEDKRYKNKYLAKSLSLEI